MIGATYFIGAIKKNQSCKISFYSNCILLDVYNLFKTFNCSNSITYIVECISLNRIIIITSIGIIFTRWIPESFRLGSWVTQVGHLDELALCNTFYNVDDSSPSKNVMGPPWFSGPQMQIKSVTLSPTFPREMVFSLLRFVRSMWHMWSYVHIMGAVQLKRIHEVHNASKDSLWLDWF